MVKKLYFPVFGSGLGHASRMVEVANKLTTLGYQIVFSTSGEAVDYIERSGYKCFRIPNLDVGWTPSGKFEGLLRTSKKLPWNIALFIRQIIEERKILQIWTPHLVISDSRLSAIFAAKSLGIPSVVVTNQLRVMLPPKKRTKRTLPIERLLNEILGNFWFISKKIYFPDIPPPLTISEESLWHISSVRKKSKYIGFIIKSKNSQTTSNHLYAKLKLSKEKPVVFAQISGPSLTKPRILQLLLKVSKEISSKTQIIISEGNPNGSIIPKRINGALYYEWCPIINDLYNIADLLILRGGHSTLGQVMPLAKPLILIPIADHSEQISNVIKISKIGSGLWLDPTTISSGKIIQSINTVLKDQSFKAQAKQLAATSKRYNGLENLQIEIIKLTK